MMFKRQLSSVDRLDRATKGLNCMIARERFFMRIERIVSALLSMFGLGHHHVS